MEANWQTVFKIVIMLFVAACGAPFTAWVKIGLTKVFKKVIEDRLAVVVTAIVAFLFAMLETWLSGALKFGDITLANFPTVFLAVLGVASLYFGWLKNSEGFFGKGFLLKPPEI